MIDFDTFTKLPKRWEIWAKELLPKALKSCLKCKKLPNLVTLVTNARGQKHIQMTSTELEKNYK